MTVTASPIYPQTFTTGVVTILPADTSNKKTVYTAGASGSKIDNLMVTNTDTGAYTVNIWITISATAYLIGTVSIPLSSGNTTAAPTVNLLNAANFTILNTDAMGNHYLYLASGATLQVSSTTTVAAAKALTFVAQGGDY